MYSHCASASCDAVISELDTKQWEVNNATSKMTASQSRRENIEPVLGPQLSEAEMARYFKQITMLRHHPALRFRQEIDVFEVENWDRSPIPVTNKLSYRSVSPTLLVMCCFC